MNQEEAAIKFKQTITKPVMTTIRYSCGCGWHIKTAHEAQFHVQVTGHKVLLSGEIYQK